MGKLLDTIHSPADIKSFTVPELEALAQEIREQLILVLSKTGGHLGPNLGVVELTLAMHYVFNTPSDRFVFDVSHQAYIHKLLTGRRTRFNTMRQPGGLNGFTLRTESDHDCYGAGHAGTALSAALGMAVARDLAGTKENVIAFAGDAAFTNGISFEALNNIAQQTKRLIVVLNDNEWSIAKNVGAIAKSGHPRALDTIRRILLASAAIPGAFPPTMFDVTLDGTAYQEMHVDGGQFVVPAVAYVIRNGRLDPEWATTERSTMGIAGRAIATMIAASGLNDVLRMYNTTQRDGIDFNLAYIGTDFTQKLPEPFDQGYMRALFDYGYQRARRGYDWSKAPPV